MNLFSYLTLTLIELNIIIKMNPLNQVEEFPSRRAARRAATSWRHALACVLCACLSGLFGCTRQPPTQPATPTSEASRIICGSPAIAEIVFSLGCGDRVVGVSAFTDWPPVAAQKPIIGDALTPNREKLLALQPECPTFSRVDLAYHLTTLDCEDASCRHYLVRDLASNNLRCESRDAPGHEQRITISCE